MSADSQDAVVPRHVGLILDGNRRWAHEQGLPTRKGYFRGYEKLKEISFELFDRGVEVVSAYVFSTENWQRKMSEVSYLMELALRAFGHEVQPMINRGISIKFIGSHDRLDPKLSAAISKAEAKSADGTKGTLALCLNYGGYEEIVHAYKMMLQQGVKSEEATTSRIADFLYHPEVPVVDIIVRTSGEQRLSNFMLWRAAYSELFFMKKYWPDMTKEDAGVIIEEYGRRKRRFGA